MINHKSDGTVQKAGYLPLQNVAYAVEIVEGYGIDIQPHLEKSGLFSLMNDTSNEEEISRAQYYTFIEDIINEQNIPAFGFKVGQKFSNADYGVLGYAFISSRTLGHAIKTFMRYQLLVGSGGAYNEELIVDEEHAVIRFSSNLLQAELCRFEVEEAMGQWSSIDVLLKENNQFKFSKVHFSFPKPSYFEYLESQFGCTVLYDQPENELFFPKLLLSHEFSMANEVTSKICAQKCESLLVNLKNLGGFVEKVRSIIVEQAGKAPNSKLVADRLSISERTLRRHLKNEGASFKGILEEVRMNIAQDYLRQTTLSVQEISYLLDYSEVSNFHRAFKSWCQQTPNEYRDVTQLD